MSSHQRLLGLFATALKFLEALEYADARGLAALKKMERPVTGRSIESVSVVPPFAGAGWWGPDQCPQVRDDGGGATERGLSAFPRRALAHW